MISNREVWACAQLMLTQHGERAPVVIAERIGALALAGDEPGLATWKRIAAAASVLGGYSTMPPAH